MGLRLRQRGRTFLAFFEMQFPLIHYLGGQKNSEAEGSLDILNPKIIRLTLGGADFFLSNLLIYRFEDRLEKVPVGIFLYLMVKIFHGVLNLIAVSGFLIYSS